MLPITPLDLDAWAGRTAARSELPVLVRKLVHARAVSLSHVDFPAYEGVDSGGWDGEVVAEGADPWIPNGASFWELSCQKELSGKASRDFAKRTAHTSSDVRASATFVFVTSRRWPGKTAWRNARRKEASWADVQVYDAEILAQWVEQAPAAMAWMQARLGRPTTDLVSPEDLWDDWAGVTAPNLPLSIFDEALEENRERLGGFFKSSTDNVLDVAADTRAEAAAFCVRLMLASDLPVADRQRAVVARTPAGLQHLKSLAAPLTIIVPNAEVEANLGGLTGRAKLLVAHDKSNLDPTTGATVEPLTWTAFGQLADDLGLDGQARERLDDESGRRISILRRRLSTVRGLRLPTWASRTQLSRPLAGLALAGGWYWGGAGDRAILLRLTGLPEAELESAIKTLASIEDAPLFLVGDAAGVISRPDTFNALRGTLTNGDIDRYIEIVLEVLTAPDPGLELREDQRWAANIYGKDRPHSGRLRANLADTLTFLAVSSEALLGGQKASGAAEHLVRRLFESEDPDIWLHVRDVLPSLAEAAPDAFLRAIERDLDAEVDDVGVWRLIKPVKNTNDHNLRTGLLWALERLAWAPERFGRVMAILAALSRRPLQDNWVNRPDGSLAMIFHPLMSQTAAPEALQVRGLEALNGRYPEAAWSLAMGILDQRMPHGAHTARPRYRSDAVGHGQQGLRPALLRKAFELVLTRPAMTLAEVIELIEKSPCFDGGDLDQLWDRVLAWSQDASEGDRAQARDAVRKNAFWRGTRKRRGRFAPDPRAREIYEALQPHDLHERYKWLFKNAWVHLDDETDGEDEPDYRAREARGAAAQASALKEIWESGGLAGLVAFGRLVQSPEFLGRRALQTLDDLAPAGVCDLLLDPDLADWVGREAFVSGALHSLEPQRRQALLEAQMAAWDAKGFDRTPLLLVAPAESEVWSLVDTLREAEKAAFWRQTHAYVRGEPALLNRLCRELLDVGRARAAFARAEMDFGVLDPDLIVEIVEAIAYKQGPPDEDRPIGGGAVEDFLDALDLHGERFSQKILVFEFLFCRHLKYTKRGLKALSAAIAGDPAILVQAVAGYMRRDDNTEEEVAPEAIAAMKQQAERWWHILDHCGLGPGADADGHIDPERFQAWMVKAMEELAAKGRVQRGTRQIGKIVGRTRRNVGGVWPSPSLALALEPWADEHFREGLFLGLAYRGVVEWRSDEGGTKERRLAARWRALFERFDMETPKLASVFLEVAEHFESRAGEEDERAALHRAAPD